MQKLTKILFKTIRIPNCWLELSFGKCYLKALEQQLNPWLTKMYGFYMLKIGNLSAEINTEKCAISHQISVSIQGYPVHVRADPLHLPFVRKSIDACLLVHTLSWCKNPCRLLCEVNRVLIDDGWMIITGFNPVSLIGLYKLIPILCQYALCNSYMFTMTRQINWLSLLNFEVLHYSSFQVIPWTYQGGGKLLNTYFSILGCLQLLVARKRRIPLTPNFYSTKQSKIRKKLSYAKL